MTLKYINNCSRSKLGYISHAETALWELKKPASDIHWCDTVPIICCVISSTCRFLEIILKFNRLDLSSNHYMYITPWKLSILMKEKSEKVQPGRIMINHGSYKTNCTSVFAPFLFSETDVLKIKIDYAQLCKFNI